MQQKQILKKEHLLIHQISLKKTDLADLKFDIEKLDIDKLKNVHTNLSKLKTKVDKLGVARVPVDLSKLSDVVKLMLSKKMYIIVR